MFTTSKVRGIPYTPYGHHYTVSLPSLLNAHLLKSVPVWKTRMRLIRPSDKTNKYFMQYAMIVKKNFPGGDDSVEDIYNNLLEENSLIAIMLPIENQIDSLSGASPEDEVLAGCELTCLDTIPCINNICNSHDKMGYSLRLIDALKEKFDKLCLEVFEYDENIINCGDWERLLGYYKSQYFIHTGCRFPVEEKRFRKVKHLRRVHCLKWESTNWMERLK